MTNMDQNTLVEQLLAMTLDIEHAATMANWQKINRIRAIDAVVAADAKTTQLELQGEYNDMMRKAQGASKYLQGARF
jgi:flagellar protein FliT